MKKSTVVWLFVIAFFFLPCICSYMDEEGNSANDYARIVNMDYKAVVVDEPDCEGKIVVTERMTFDVHAASQYNGFWELWRDLCEDYVDGVKVHYKVNSVKQIMPDGTEVLWEESDKLYWDDYDYVSSNPKYGPEKWYHSPGPYNEEYDRYECVFFYVDNLYREKITFEIEYEMYNAVLRYGDCSDLYIAMYSGETIEYLESFNAQILIPEDKMPSKGNYQATTYGTNAYSFPFEESATKNPGYYTFSFELDEDDLQFKPYNEYIEFDLVAFNEDKHIFAEYASRNDYYDDVALEEILDEQEYYKNAPELHKQMRMVAFTVCMVISGFVILGAVIKFARLKKRCPSINKKDIPTYRDIPSGLDPKFAASLVFCKDKKQEDDAGVYSSLLLSLARKKYIELQEVSDNDVLIILKDEIMPEFIPNFNFMPEVMINCDYCNASFDVNKFKTCPHCGGSYHDDQEYIDKTVNDGFSLSAAHAGLYNNIEPVEELEILTTCEEHYLNLIKRHAVNGSINMEVLQNRISSDYDYTDSFVRNIQKSVVDTGINKGFFQKANYLEPMNKLKKSGTKHIIWGILIFVLANIISYQTPVEFANGGYAILGIFCFLLGIFYKTQAHKYILLTEYGKEEYIKWRGLYNFLKSDTLINEKTMIELPLWERYLVYATAFGISDKVIEAIKIHCPESAAATTSIVHNSYCRSGRIRTSGRRFHSSVRRGSRGHSYSSGGGGYGGGGRGGGGGGGGH